MHLFDLQRVSRLAQGASAALVAATLLVHLAVNVFTPYGLHRDELLFQTVHQSSELWLKLAWNEVEEAGRLIAADDLAAAIPSAIAGL